MYEHLSSFRYQAKPEIMVYKSRLLYVVQIKKKLSQVLFTKYWDSHLNNIILHN